MNGKYWLRAFFVVFFFCLTYSVGSGVFADTVDIECGGCKNTNCFEISPNRNSIQCQRCSRCYSPSHLIYGFNNNIRHVGVGGASMGGANLAITLPLNLPVLSGQFNVQEVLQMFHSNLQAHQQLITSSLLQSHATTVITPELVETILQTTPSGVEVVTALRQVRRAIILAILLARYVHPELASDQNALNLEVMVLATNIYSSFQHSQSHGQYNYLLSHGFHIVEQQYHGHLQHLNTQITNPADLIDIQPGSNAVVELFGALSHQETGYHFFTHPSIGTGALLHVGDQWTLVLNTGITISAPKDDLVTLLAMAHWGMMDYLQDVGMTLMGAAVGAVVGILINVARGGRILACHAGAALLGGAIGGTVAGAAAVSSHISDSKERKPESQDERRKKNKKKD